ncbi:MAG: histidine--tRNA ligase [Actinomycetota bacterium]|nr:histidine--tRNA ligase [Actinomycetota bacterium]
MDLQPPRGTEDLLPPGSAEMAELYVRAHRLAAVFGYRYVETPAFESTDLFARTSGESSDVVTKEMYTFKDRGGRSLTLRAEGTAPVVRAYLAHSHDLGSPFKAYYVNTTWRYGRPQAGRLREFRIFGAEVLGVAGAEADVEVVVLADRFLRDLGLSRLELQVNSIGDETCRPAYRELLVAYLEEHREELTDEHRDRFRMNPLRVLDCKDEACRAVSAGAPKIVDHLCEPCRQHFEEFLSVLESEGVKAVLTPTLVRGLDYYTRTAFEFVSDVLPQAQAGTVCGGGRYDGLAEVLGGPPTPGVGFGLGLDRTLLAARAEGVDLGVSTGVTCFVVGIGPGRARGHDLLRQVRAAGVSADASFEERPLKAQLRMADRSGARFALIVGDQEVAEGTVTVRRMEDGHQEKVPATDVPTWISAQA